MTREARWNAELQMKLHVVKMGNVWLRSDVSDGVLTAAQYKTVVQGVARDLAGSAWVNHPWDGTLYAEVYLRLMQKKSEARKECWGESTLKSAMRAIPAAGPTEALQHVGKWLPCLTSLAIAASLRGKSDVSSSVLFSNACA